MLFPERLNLHIHARRQIELFKTLSANNPSYKCRLKSNRILLAAMSLVRESHLEGLIIERVKKLT